MMPFKAYIRVFGNYVLAMDEELSEARKCALLIHYLGAEDQRLFYMLKITDDKCIASYSHILCAKSECGS